MTGAVASPINFGQAEKSSEEFSFAGRLRRTRSLCDLHDTEIVLKVTCLQSGQLQQTTASLRRKISSVEDFATFEARTLKHSGSMASSFTSLGDVDAPSFSGSSLTSSVEDPSPTFNEKLTLDSLGTLTSQLPCTGLNCDGRCIESSAPSTTKGPDPANPTSQVTSSSSPIILEEKSHDMPIDDRIDLDSPCFVPSTTRRDVDDANKTAVGFLGASPPSNGRQGTSIILDSLKFPMPSAFAAALSSPTGSRASTPSVDGLDVRRNSCDLGHVAPPTGHLGQGSAAVELFYRLNHARQTVDYVKRQAAQYAPLNHASMDVWQALELLNTLREYESALVGAEACDPDIPLMDHALQTAEACRLAFPEHDWMALVGLIHGLGKLLAHASFGAEPQWAVCGESFPVGCRFHPSVVHSQYFQANPDRRRRVYASPTGVYQPGCGLSAVCMSWSGAEYLYMVLARNRTLLPPEALFMIRYQKFAAMLRPGQPYGELLSNSDKNLLPMLTKFRELAEYRRMEVPGRLEGQALKDYYDALLAKYIPQSVLRW